MEKENTIIPVVKLTLTQYEADELAHIMQMHLIPLRHGDLGSGISIDNNIKFCEDLYEVLTGRKETK